MEVYKITLSTGKVVFIRPFTMKVQELSVKVAGQKAGPSNEALYSFYLTQELVKNLLVKVDKKELAASDLEILDDHLTPVEFSQVQKVIVEIGGFQGLQDAPSPKFELVSSFGNK